MKVLPWIAACAIGFAACGERPDSDAAANVLVRDSAGMRLVELGPNVEGLADSCLDPEESFGIGREGSALELFRVEAARLLPSGGLAVGNAGTSEVLVVDSMGRLVARLGGPGEGPGEFGTITSLHTGPDGSIAVYDDREGRLTRFGPTGELVGVRRMAEPSSISDLVPLVVSQDGAALAVFGDNRTFGQSGIRHDSTPLLRLSGESTVPDTLSMWATKVWSFTSEGDGVIRAELAFGPDLKRAGRGERAALAESHGSEITVVDGDGNPVIKIRWDEAPRPVTDDDYETWQSDRRAELPETLPEGLREALIGPPRHETHPVWNEVVVDSEAGIWLAPTSLAEGADQTWIRIRGDGTPTRCVTLPSESVLLDATGVRMAVLGRDEFGVETVQVLFLPP